MHVRINKLIVTPSTSILTLNCGNHNCILLLLIHRYVRHQFSVSVYLDSLLKCQPGACKTSSRANFSAERLVCSNVTFLFKICFHDKKLYRHVIICFLFSYFHNISVHDNVPLLCDTNVMNCNRVSIKNSRNYSDHLIRMLISHLDIGLIDFRRTVQEIAG